MPSDTVLGQPELGEALRTARGYRGMSLRDLADEIGVSFNTLSRVERGRLPDLGNYDRIVTWLAGPSAAPSVGARVFSFDAETDGLYGAVWAIGAVVLDGEDVVADFKGQIDPAVVTDPWVRENIVPVVDLPRVPALGDLLEAFWSFWSQHRDDTLCVADFGAPVEAGLFRACIERDLAARMWQGPYPMHELGTALLLAGIDPDVNRREMAGQLDLVQHDPYDDALAAGLCWQIATARARVT